MRYFELRFDPDVRDRRRRRGRAARRDPGRPGRRRLARPRPHPAQPAGDDRRHAAHQRLQPRARRAGVQAALQGCPGDAAAGAVRRDLRLLARGRGHPPARRPDRPRRPALVGPPGLPHRGLRADARAAHQERRDRARGRQGRLLPQDPPTDRDPAEVEKQYVTYTRSLLWVTDNLVDGAVVRPQRVRVRDGDDTYLVVAADKGTATFSDTANRVSQEYGFWLDDAFASGGSAGYDHKALGITAKGAWESVKRHFKELGVDTQSDEFTVVGIGDMSGDVFGNGMLLSEHIRLVAAYDHRHIFIDPAPDAATGLRGAQAAVRARRLELGRLRPRADQRRAAACSRARPSRSGSRRRRARRWRSRRSRWRRPTSSARSCARPSTCCGTAASAPS